MNFHGFDYHKNRFKIDDLDIYFPFPYIYKEQYEYICELKKTLDQKGHTILEMPTGTGKTVSLLSLIISYQSAYPENFKKVLYITLLFTLKFH